ncbi:hypothetical protein HN832_03770 [archaeon]|jgi:hypothetical protein|nr:hypothetical protein [archaeon]MBT4373487.1 hypothetical protein [archaeon]MBT4531935.1 hypothetical protein [archaeon]MBT7001602.1 hypothetical protein [archaeon]MBT7282506.1 hypothetical protein [archaeon]
MKNKKGLSAVITTVIFVSLALIAIGIVWAVISDIVQQGAEGVETRAGCLEVDVKATEVTSVNETYNITLKRSGGGDAISGIKVVLMSDSEASSVLDVAGNIESLATEVKSVDGEILNANKIEITPYLVDSTGAEVTCTTTTFEF